ATRASCASARARGASRGASGRAWPPEPASRRLAPPAPEQERRVDAAEGEVVAHHELDLARARLALHVVERRAARVELVEVQRRSEPALAEHLDREPRLDGARGAERAADMALEADPRRAR